MDGATSVQLSVYKHGTGVSTAADHSAVQADLVTARQLDRAGAPAEPLWQPVIDRLRDKHAGVFYGEDICWRLWATYILSLPTAAQEEAVAAPPPLDIVHFFTRSAVNTYEAAENLRRTVVLCHDVLDGVTEAIAPLRADLEASVRRLEALEHTVRIFERAVHGFEAGLAPFEGTQARHHRSRIENMLDHDHAA
jgi:hypothetical protein